MKKHKIVLVVGARPNFMKAAPLLKEFNRHTDKIEPILIHTGQHYDHNLSQFFFDDLKLPKSDYYLGVGSGSHAEQTGQVMVELEKKLLEINPDLTIVFGDINSTLATAVVTSKLFLKLAHIEAGLRSFDKTMPEEINRIVTDRLSDLLFVTEQAGVDNLLNEGVNKDKIHLVGNIMIDSLKHSLENLDKSEVLNRLSLNDRPYAVLTLHRPSNVDNKATLRLILDTLKEISKKLPIIFPSHPRTLKMLEKFGFDSYFNDDLRLIDPLGYIDFLKLMANSKFVLTDSGGIQGDTTYLKIPCLTIRENSEQPVTFEIGSNRLCGINKEMILDSVNSILDGTYKKSEIPPLWDGASASRITKIILDNLA